MHAAVCVSEKYNNKEYVDEIKVYVTFYNVVQFGLQCVRL